MESPPRAQATNARDWTRLDLPLLTILTLMGGVLRFVRLDVPSAYEFDEKFYVRDACWYVRRSVSLCGTTIERNIEHPPLAKWLISLGIKAFGFDAFGWRVVAAVAGTITIALMYLLARKLLRSTLGAALAAGTMALDFLHFVHSRIAMLDIFLLLFVAAAFLFLVYDRDHILERRSGWRPWRLAAGAACGAALACKWSGGFNLVAIATLSIAWEVSRRSDRGRLAGFRETLRSDGLGLCVAFVIAPIVVFALAHVGRVHGDLLALPWNESSWLNALWDRQAAALTKLLDLSMPNPTQSPPWSWLLSKRGIPYRIDSSGGNVYQITGTGNPLVWWASIPALLYVFVVWLRRNDPRRPEGAIVSGFFWNFAPWVVFASAPFLFQSGRSAVFLFYALPLEPFMFLALSLVAVRVSTRAMGKIAVAVFAAGTVASFAFFYPILAYVPLSPAAYDARLWIFDDCKRPDRAPATILQVTREDGVPTTNTFARGRSFLAPEGWCWGDPLLLRRGPTRFRQPPFEL